MYGAASAARRFVSERAISVGARTVAEALSARFLPGNFSWRAKGPYGRDSCHILKGRMGKVTRLGSLLGSAASVGDAGRQFSCIVRPVPRRLNYIAIVSRSHYDTNRSEFKRKGCHMEKELFNYVAQRAEVLATSDTSTQVTKDAAEAWKAAVDADASEGALEAATKALLDVLEGRPTTIDGVIAFAEGPAKQLMGEEAAAAMLSEQLKRKEAGAKYCNCPSCTAASELLAKFGRIEL